MQAMTIQPVMIHSFEHILQRLFLSGVEIWILFGNRSQLRYLFYSIHPRIRKGCGSLDALATYGTVPIRAKQKLRVQNNIILRMQRKQDSNLLP